MTFTSLPFILYITTVFVMFCIAPLRLRWLVLLLASYYFYSTLKTPYLLLALAMVTCVSYFSGKLIYKSESEVSRKLWLVSGIVINLSILIWLRYLPFICENVNLILDGLNIGQRFPAIRGLIAVGVSYYVFQGISYIIDVYLEVLVPEPHPGHFALSMGFFPKLLQGPIERGGNLLPQLRILKIASWDDMKLGLHMFIWGMFKKVVIADRLASFVDPIYGNVTQHFGLSLIAATYLFALQLYFDFSGYTDMALGIARCFNIRLTQNFNAPYFSTSVAEFWRRWHISFSSWILDYIFKPLQFQFRDWKTWGTALALMITFLASGLWHGASWSFVVWGGIHGCYLGGAVLFRQGKKKFCKRLGLERSRLFKIWQVLCTFNLVCFSWVFFRAKSLDDAFFIAWNSVAGMHRSLSLLGEGRDVFLHHLFGAKSTLEVAGVGALLLFSMFVGVFERRIRKDGLEVHETSWLNHLPFWSKGFVYGFLCYLMAFCGASTQSFIYLQF